MSSKFVILGIVLSLLSFNINAQFNTKVKIGGIYDSNLKAKIESNSSSFLSDLNRAFSSKVKPSRSPHISDDAYASLLAMWEMSPFRIMETEIIENVARRSSGNFEMRNIPIFMANASEGNQLENIALIFDGNGIIENVNITVYTPTDFLYGKDVTEIRRREIILEFIENFRTAYNRKDSNYLDVMFSEDALIITGKVVESASKDASNQLLSQEVITYQKQTKSEYLSRLKSIFQINEYINIKFDEIEIKQHKKYPSIYQVQLRQEWNTSKYSDAGFLLVVIDFTDEDKPLIQVRTWQPEKLNGKRLSDDEKIDMDKLNFGGKVNEN